METEPLTRPEPTLTDEASVGFGPTPDPTRSGALWVGGAGVALLLAAAGVLTAVRWDDIGQSAKLGALVAVTLSLLGAGRRWSASVPMTAQAIFHLGALLIPFDMAAVAILAGRSWQETLLLTSATSVAAWYGIERAERSALLRWSARLGVIALAAGVAAMSSIAMALALAIAASIGLAMRSTSAAGLWAAVAAVLPLAAFVPWPTRIAGAMSDLGFDALDPWQPLIAGSIATLVLMGVARQAARVEVGWSAVAAGLLTMAVALTGFADSQVTYLSFASLFLAIELGAMAARSDTLWRPIIGVVAAAAEVVTFMTTLVALAAVVHPSAFFFAPSATSVGLSGTILVIAWLTADVRRADAHDDWISAMVLGSNWWPTTVMVPIAALTAGFVFGVQATAFSLLASALGYWMVATWRTGGTVGAVGLAAIAMFYGSFTSMWVEVGLGAVAAAVLVIAANLRERSRQSSGAVVVTLMGLLVWLVATDAVVTLLPRNWPLGIVVVGAWMMSWAVEYGRADAGRRPADWLGRLGAVVIVVASMTVAPLTALGLCLIVAVLAGADYGRTHRTLGRDRATKLQVFSATIGAAVGLAAVPAMTLAGLPTATGGAALAVAGFIAAGIALASPRAFELPLGAASLVMSLVGLGLALGDEAMFAFALIAAGCTLMFIAAALRHIVLGIAGYVATGVGVSLELAAFEVTALEPYLLMPAVAALAVGWHYQRLGGSSWAAYAPTIALYSYVAIADRFAGGSAWHAVVAGTVGVLSIIAGGYRRLVGPLVTGSAVLAIVVGYESLGPASLVPTWAWLATGGTVLLTAGVLMERSDTTPLERGQQLRTVIATQFT